MPDTNWSHVNPATKRVYEERYQNGDAPTNDMGRPEEETKIIPPGTPLNKPHIKIEITTWSSVTCTPPSELVLEECDKCNGHSHRVKILFGAVVGTPPGGVQGPDVGDQQHVKDAEYGAHLGERYTNSRCRGEEIDRSVLTWSVSGRQLVVWKSRKVDHIKNGFVWISDISHNPCAEREEVGDLYDPDWLEDGEAAAKRKT